MSNKVDSIEHLLKPRYKAIADYPSSHMYFKVGDVLEWDDKNGGYRHGNGVVMMHKTTVEYYPHLFKKLEWWEERAVKEMPQYVKNIADRKVFKVDKNFYNGNYSIQAFKLGEAHFTIGNTTCYYSDFLPATEADYLNQNKKQ